MVHTVGIVPENAKVWRGRLHARKAPHGFIAVGIAVRVGIQRHTPNALHGAVLHQLLHKVHVRPLRPHGDIQHLKAKLLRHAEVPVVTRHRADKFGRRACFPPGPTATGEALAPAKRHLVIHHLKAGVSAHHHFLRLHAKHLCKKAACLRHAFQCAIVARVGSALAVIICHVQKVHRKVQLFCGRFAARHIQRKPPCHIPLICCQQGRTLCLQRGFVHCQIICHTPSSLFLFILSLLCGKASLRPPTGVPTQENIIL